MAAVVRLDPFDYIRRQRHASSHTHNNNTGVFHALTASQPVRKRVSHPSRAFASRVQTAKDLIRLTYLIISLCRPALNPIHPSLHLSFFLPPPLSYPLSCIHLFLKEPSFSLRSVTCTPSIPLLNRIPVQRHNIGPTSWRIKAMHALVT